MIRLPTMEPFGVVAKMIEHEPFGTVFDVISLSGPDENTNRYLLKEIYAKDAKRTELHQSPYYMRPRDFSNDLFEYWNATEEGPRPVVTIEKMDGSKMRANPTDKSDSFYGKTEDFVPAILQVISSFQNDTYDYAPTDSIDDQYFGIFFLVGTDVFGDKMDITFLSTTPELDFSEIRKILKPLRKYGKLRIATKKDVFDIWKEENPYLYNWQFDDQDSYTAWHSLEVKKDKKMRKNPIEFDEELLKYGDHSLWGKATEEEWDLFQVLEPIVFASLKETDLLTKDINPKLGTNGIWGLEINDLNEKIKVDLGNIVPTLALYYYFTKTLDHDPRRVIIKESTLGYTLDVHERPQILELEDFRVKEFDERLGLYEGNFKKNPIHHDYEGGNAAERKLLQQLKPIVDNVIKMTGSEKHGITYINWDFEEWMQTDTGYYSIGVDCLCPALALYYHFAKGGSDLVSIQYAGGSTGELYLVTVYKNKRSKEMYGPSAANTVHLDGPKSVFKRN